MEPPPQMFCLKRNDYTANVVAVFKSDGAFTDVTLVSSDEKIIKAHKPILSMGSRHFANLLDKFPSDTIILSDIKYSVLKLLIDFIYLGKIELEKSMINSVLETGRFLKVKGLSYESPAPSAVGQTEQGPPRKQMRFSKLTEEEDVQAAPEPVPGLIKPNQTASEVPKLWAMKPIISPAAQLLVISNLLRQNVACKENGAVMPAAVPGAFPANPPETDAPAAAAKPPARGTYKKYAEETLKTALEQIRDGHLSARKASQIYGIPNRTLRDHMVKCEIKSIFVRERQKKASVSSCPEPEMANGESLKQLKAREETKMEIGSTSEPAVNVMTPLTTLNEA